MKFIGQYIQSFIARFRSDVYLEDISTGTIASGGNLGLDANNKIVKATETTGDITGVDLTGTLPITIESETNTTSGAYSATLNLRVGDGLAIDSGDLVTNNSEIDHDQLDNFAAGEHFTQANITTVGTIGTGVWNGTAIGASYVATLNQNTTGTAATVTGATQPAIESIGTDGDTLTILSDQLHMSNATADMPTVKLTNIADDDAGASLVFEKLRDDNAVAQGQNLGEIWFRGQDVAGQTEDYAYIIGEIDVSTHNQESGQLKFGVANHDGGNGNGLILIGGSADNEIDVVVGLGTASTTTIAGTLTMGSTAAMTNAGLLSVANQSNITGVGTISSGVWQGTAIAHAYIGADAIEGDNIADNAVDSEHYTDGSIDTAHIADDQVTFAKALGVTSNVFDNKIKLIPSDFMANDDGGNSKFGVGYVETGGDSLYGMRVANNATELYAFVSIPQGMTATHVDIFDKNDLAVEVFEAQVNATTMVSKGSGNANTTIDITDVASTATNFLAIEITTTSATNDKVYGGTVTIA